MGTKLTSIIISIIGVSIALSLTYVNNNYWHESETVIDLNNDVAIPENMGIFVLTISNQSFDVDPVDIHVKLDNKTVVNKEFFVKGQHNYQTFEFTLDSGLHTISAKTTKGNYALEEKFVLEKQLWASLDFQYDDMHDEPPLLRLKISETMLVFL